jgi:hypothetical protein
MEGSLFGIDRPGSASGLWQSAPLIFLILSAISQLGIAFSPSSSPAINQLQGYGPEVVAISTTNPSPTISPFSAVPASKSPSFYHTKKTQAIPNALIATPTSGAQKSSFSLKQLTLSASQLAKTFYLWQRK